MWELLNIEKDLLKKCLVLFKTPSNVYLDLRQTNSGEMLCILIAFYLLNCFALKVLQVIFNVGMIQSLTSNQTPVPNVLHWSEQEDCFHSFFCLNVFIRWLQAEEEPGLCELDCWRVWKCWRHRVVGGPKLNLCMWKRSKKGSLVVLKALLNLCF